MHIFHEFNFGFLGVLLLTWKVMGGILSSNHFTYGYEYQYNVWCFFLVCPHNFAKCSGNTRMFYRI